MSLNRYLHAAYLLIKPGQAVIWSFYISLSVGSELSAVVAGFCRPRLELRLFFFSSCMCMCVSVKFTQPSPRSVSALVRATNSFPI